jgi:hypothetical protein
MGNFLGGSAYAMAREIAEGFHLVTERTYGRLLPAELDKLAFEMDRHLRELRGEQPATDDPQAVQKRNRKIQRLNGALMLLQGYRQRMRR